MRSLKICFFIIALSVFNGCSADVKNSYIKTQEEFSFYKDLAEKYSIDAQWWKGYGNRELDSLIETALANNMDLAKAAVNVNRSLYEAKLVGADLVPSFSGSLESSVSKEKGTSIINHSVDLMISYEVDLWKKLSNAASSKEWEYQATAQDLESSRLSIINNVINTYFHLAYVNDSISVLKETIGYYGQIRNIAQNKLNYGTGDKLSADEAARSLLEAENSLISYETEKKEQEQVLKNLLNLKPGEPLNLKPGNILKTDVQGIDLNVPISLIANRPDIKAYEYSLRSSFKNFESTQESLYPSVTLQSSLTFKDNKVSNVTNIPITYGMISINLPFLNWNAVKWNVKISQADYEAAKLDFEQGVTTALNEIDTNYYLYTQKERDYKNVSETFRYNQRISSYYEERYRGGISEMKDWLSALASKNSSQLAVLSTKYNLLISEAKVYQSIAGKINLK